MNLIRFGLVNQLIESKLIGLVGLYLVRLGIVIRDFRLDVQYYHIQTKTQTSSVHATFLILITYPSRFNFGLLLVRIDLVDLWFN